MRGGGICWESQHCSSIQSWCSMLRQTGGCGGKKQCSSDCGFCQWGEDSGTFTGSEFLSRVDDSSVCSGLKKAAAPCAGRAWGLGRVSGSACRGSADASGQTLVSPVWLFLHWLLQNIRKKKTSRRLETNPSQPWSFFSSHLTNKKSLNSWWSVNTGGDGRGGPNSGTLSSENIFNLYITRNNMVTLMSGCFYIPKFNQGSGEGCSVDPCTHL